MCVGKYAVDYWDDCEQSYASEGGFVFGESYSDMMRHLLNLYGIINRVTLLEIVGELPVITDGDLFNAGYVKNEK